MMAAIMMHPGSYLGLSSWLFLLGALGVGAPFGCTEDNVTAGTSVTLPSQCGYPRACYLKACDCKSGPEACRVLPPDRAFDLGTQPGDGGVGGGLVFFPSPPSATDPVVFCPFTTDGGAALPEMVCQARAVVCASPPDLTTFDAAADAAPDGMMDAAVPDAR